MQQKIITLIAAALTAGVASRPRANPVADSAAFLGPKASCAVSADQGPGRRSGLSRR